MGTLSRDTHPDAERKQIELLRRTLSWRRLELAVQMTQACYSLGLTGLKHRHPEALFLAAWDVRGPFHPARGRCRRRQR